MFEIANIQISTPQQLNFYQERNYLDEYVCIQAERRETPERDRHCSGRVDEDGRGEEVGLNWTECRVDLWELKKKTYIEKIIKKYYC